MSVNTISMRTLGYVLTAAQRGTSIMSKASVRTLLMSSGISDLPEVDNDILIPRASDPPAVDIMRPPLLTAHALAADGSEAAHDALVELVRQVAELLVANIHVNQLLQDLRAALITDGFEIKFGPANLMPGQLLDRRADIHPIDPDAVPLEPELTALEDELDSRGYSVALQHYQAAIKHFREQDHPSANSQIRNMIEELFVRLAVDHTGYTDTGDANQGNVAVQSLYGQGGRAPRVVGQRLPENDGGRMAHGIWQTLHTNGSHPGLSDAEEARLRMQLCTGLARFLLKHFPAKP